MRRLRAIFGLGLVATTSALLGAGYKFGKQLEQEPPPTGGKAGNKGVKS